jgi:hypothetical protein
MQAPIDAPAPWQLTGNGYIFLFRFDRAFVLENGFVDESLADSFRGGFGAVMLVDYHTSPVGPYREALFIPGLFDQHDQRRYSITKIYVSTIDSVINGQENWGIPKELANFEITQPDAHIERFRMQIDGQAVLDVLLEKLPQRLPLNTRWFPLVRPAIIQHHNNQSLLTAPRGRGQVGFARLQSAYIDPHYFPDFTQKRALMTLSAQNFELTFPEPKRLTDED